MSAIHKLEAMPPPSTHRQPPPPPQPRRRRLSMAKVVRFGEFLVERHLLDREQLLAALMAQDHAPGVPLGELVVALGYVDGREVERALGDYMEIEVVEVG